MKASLYFLHKKNSKDEHYIELRLVEGSQRNSRRICTSKENDWDKKNQRPLPTHVNYNVLLPKILELKAKIAKVQLDDYTFDEAANFLFDDPEKKKEQGYIDFFNVRIAEKKVLKESTSAYENVRNVIKNYLDRNDIPINSITYEWINKFVQYKLTDGCTQGGVMSYLRTMRAVYKEAQRRSSLNIKPDNPFIGNIKNAAPKQVIEISIKQFEKLLNYEPKKSTTTANREKIKRALNIWLFQFYIGGHDYADIALLKWSNIIDDRIRFRRFKLRNKPNSGNEINNKLFKSAREIIDKYGDKESERIFSHIPDPVAQPSKYKNHIRNVNHTLKRISDHLEFTDHIRSKSTRYLFRTYAGNLLVHDLIVMTLQGHKPTGMTYKYQGGLSQKLQDKWHKKIIKSIKGI